MNALPSGSADDHAPDPSDTDPADTPPEWAPVEPLPSSEMLLTAFAGLTPITATDILDPADDLVVSQERYRLTFEVLASGTVASERGAVCCDGAGFGQRGTRLAGDDHRRRRGQATATSPGRARPECPAAEARPVPVHTESIGEVAARMAALWEVVGANAGDVGDLPEADRLMELCEGYDSLVAETDELGRRDPRSWW